MSAIVARTCKPAREIAEADATSRKGRVRSMATLNRLQPAESVPSTLSIRDEPVQRPRARQKKTSATDSLLSPLFSNSSDETRSERLLPQVIIGLPDTWRVRVWIEDVYLVEGNSEKFIALRFFGHDAIGKERLSQPALRVLLDSGVKDLSSTTPGSWGQYSAMIRWAGVRSLSSGTAPLSVGLRERSMEISPTNVWRSPSPPLNADTGDAWLITAVEAAGVSHASASNARLALLDMTALICLSTPMRRSSSSAVVVLLLDACGGTALAVREAMRSAEARGSSVEPPARALSDAAGGGLLATHSRPRAAHCEQGVPPSRCRLLAQTRVTRITRLSTLICESGMARCPGISVAACALESGGATHLPSAHGVPCSFCALRTVGMTSASRVISLPGGIASSRYGASQLSTDGKR